MTARPISASAGSDPERAQRSGIEDNFQIATQPYRIENREAAAGRRSCRKRVREFDQVSRQRVESSAW
jgi:hypothetical protein